MFYEVWNFKIKHTILVIWVFRDLCIEKKISNFSLNGARWWIYMKPFEHVPELDFSAHQRHDVY